MTPTILETEKPILIVDKEGQIGLNLASKLTEKNIVVLATERNIEVSNNLIHIRYAKKFPIIPNNTYSYIYVVDDGSVTREAISSFIDKARQDDAEIIIVTDIKGSFSSNVEEAVFYKSARVAVLGEIFSKDFNNLYSPLNHLLRISDQSKRINVPGDGTASVYPSEMEMIIDGLLKITLYKEGKYFNFFPKHPLTFLSFARMLQKGNPEYGIDFVEAYSQNKNETPKEGIHLFSDEEIKKQIKEVKLEGKPQREVKERKEKKIKIKKLKRSKSNLFSFIAFILLIALMPFLSTLILSLSAAASLKSTESYLREGEIEKAKASADRAEKMFRNAKASANVVSFEASIVRQQGLIEPVIAKLEKGESLSQGVIHLLTSVEKLEKVLSGDSNNPEEDFSKGTDSLKQTISILQKEKAEGNKDFSLSELDGFLNLVSNTIDVWPTLFGFDGEKKYLLVFQNNMELRPSGGFIGSYGTVSVNKGKLSELKIYDVYDADGQLKAHVEPAFPIRRYLPSAHLYLRDSNYDYEFSGASTSIASLYNLETGEKVDGIIGVDVTVVKKLLEIFGPVQVSDYSKEVNSENFFILTEGQAEKNFFPGSTQKKDFLGSLFRALQQKIFEGKKQYVLEIAKVIGESLEEKHLLLASQSVSVQKLFSYNGWSSSIIDERKEEEATINDFLGIVEANLGVNKSNYYLQRSISQNVNISQKGKVTETVTLSYKNLSQNSTWPGGTYKSYARLIVPKFAKLKKIEINDKEQETIPAITNPKIYEVKSFTPPKELEVEETTNDNNTIFGFLITVSPQELKTIKVTYELLDDVSLKENVKYSNIYYKQAGTEDYPYDFSINFPASYRLVKNESLNLSEKEGAVYFSEKIKTDKNFLINLNKK